MAQVLLLTIFVAEAGFCLLPLAFLREIEKDVLTLLDQASTTDEWNWPDRLIGPITETVNEHDRHLREVRLSVMLDAKDRLERMIVAAPDHLAASVGD